MTIRFPYKNIPPLEVPDDNLMGCYRPKRFPDAPPLEDLLAHSLANPVGAPPLRDAVKGRRNLLFLVDDNTRPTPAAKLLPQILDELHAGGIGDSQIQFLIASGSHRAMTDDEKREKLGGDVCDRYPVHDHDYDDSDLLCHIGELEDGEPIIVNRRVVEADFVMGVGHIVPHRTQGFGGGAKIVLPGVSGRAALNHMHWEATKIPIPDLLGKPDNPIRRMSNEYAQKAGLKYIVNVVLDDEERVISVWSGDPVEAHRRGCDSALDVYGIRLPRPADICVIDSYPADIDLWQANKAFFAAEGAVREGGVIVLVTPSPEGASKAHPDLVKMGYSDRSQVKEWIEEGKLKPGAPAAALVDGGAVLRHATGILVSPGISKEDQKKLGFVSADTPDEALGKAFERAGREGCVAVVHHGGEVVLTAGQAS